MGLRWSTGVFPRVTVCWSESPVGGRMAETLAMACGKQYMKVELEFTKLFAFFGI